MRVEIVNCFFTIRGFCLTCTGYVPIIMSAKHKQFRTLIMTTEKYQKRKRKVKNEATKKNEIKRKTTFKFCGQGNYTSFSIQIGLELFPLA